MMYDFETKGVQKWLSKKNQPLQFVKNAAYKEGDSIGKMFSIKNDEVFFLKCDLIKLCSDLTKAFFVYKIQTFY